MAERKPRAGKKLLLISSLAMVLIAGSAVCDRNAHAQNASPSELAKDVVPRAGEIALEGNIVEAHAGSVVLRVRSFLLPNGRGRTFETPREKTVLWTAATVLRNQTGEVLTAGQKLLRPGLSLIVVGQDQGSGSALKARTVRLTQAVRVLDKGVRRSAAPPLVVLPDEATPNASRTAAQRIDYSRLTLRKTYVYGGRQLDRAVAFSPDGKWLSVGGDGVVWILERNTGQVRLLPVLDSIYTPGKATPAASRGDSRELFVRQLFFSHDSQNLFIRGSFNRVQMMPVRSGQIVKTFDYNEHEPQLLSTMALSALDRALLMAGKDGQVKLLDLTTNKILRVLKTRHPIVTAVAFSGDGSRIVSASVTPAPSKPTQVSTMRQSATGSVEVWDTETGKLLRSTSLSHLDLSAMQLSRTGSFLLGSYVDDNDYVESAQIWDVRRQAITNRFSTGYPEEVKGYVNDVALSPDNSVFAVLSEAMKYQPSDKSYAYPFLTLYRGRLQMWPRTPPTGDAVLASPSPPAVSIEIKAMMSHVAWAPDARTLAVIGNDGTARGRTIQIYSVDEQ